MWNIWQQVHQASNWLPGCVLGQCIGNIVHCTLYTALPVNYLEHCKLYSVNCLACVWGALYIVQYKLLGQFEVKGTLYTLHGILICQYTGNSVHCILYTVWPKYRGYCTLYTTWTVHRDQFKLYTVLLLSQCTGNIVHFTLYRGWPGNIVHCIIYTAWPIHVQCKIYNVICTLDN